MLPYILNLFLNCHLQQTSNCFENMSLQFERNSSRFWKRLLGYTIFRCFWLWRDFCCGVVVSPSFFNSFSSVFICVFSKCDSSVSSFIILGRDLLPCYVGTMTSSDSIVLLFRPRFRFGFWDSVWPLYSSVSQPMNDVISGIESVPRLSALNDAFGCSTVYLNQPTNWPQTYWLSYSLQFLYACLLYENLSIAEPLACLTSHLRMITSSLRHLWKFSLWVK